MIRSFSLGSYDAEYSCTWDEFTEIANREYDNGFGAAEVAGDLIVLFSTGKKLWRAEYDGSEWWEYDTPGDVDYTKVGKPILTVIGGLWNDLAEQHRHLAESDTP